MVGRVKVAEYVNVERFEDALDSMIHNERVRVIQYGPGSRDGYYYIVYESRYEGSPHEVRNR